ncbi:MAG: hypothetical protein E4G99_06935, partial [Anaerolineales bacterium]
MTEETNPIAVESDLIEPTTSEPGVMTRVGRVVFRILVAVVVGLALGVGLYYGTLRLYREVIEPIQGYEARIGDLERSLDMMRQELKTDSSDLNARQAEIEGRLAKQSEATASVEALVEAAQADLREQRTILSTVGDLSEGLDDLSLALGSVSMRVDQLEADIAAGDLSAQKVQRTAVYLRAMTLLTRARIELDRDNLGFAREQVEAAQATLNELVVSDLETKVV